MVTDNNHKFNDNMFVNNSLPLQKSPDISRVKRATQNDDMLLSLPNSFENDFTASPRLEEKEIKLISFNSPVPSKAKTTNLTSSNSNSKTTNTLTISSSTNTTTNNTNNTKNINNLLKSSESKAQINKNNLLSCKLNIITYYNYIYNYI